MTDNDNDRKTRSEAGKPRPVLPLDNSGVPLAEEIEDELLNQDIPVETGVLPHRS
jgi:hypothetical protein